MNISCVFIVILGGTTLGQSPFNIIQLLWINLIMDVLAAIALATEAPHPTKLRKDRIRKTDRSVTPYMWRSISFQVLYQVVAMIVLLYAAPAMFNIRYHLTDSNMRVHGTPTYRMQHYTLMFQTFVLMNLANMFCCRKLPSESDRELNVFSRVHHNWWFLIIFLAELNCQYAMIGYAWVGVIFGTTPLTLGMQMLALGLALGVFIVDILVKLTPESMLRFYPEMAEDEESSKSMLLQKVSQMQSGM